MLALPLRTQKRNAHTTPTAGPIPRRERGSVQPIIIGLKAHRSSSRPRKILRVAAFRRQVIVGSRAQCIIIGVAAIAALA